MELHRKVSDLAAEISQIITDIAEAEKEESRARQHTTSLKNRLSQMRSQMAGLMKEGGYLPQEPVREETGHIHAVRGGVSARNNYNGERDA